MKQGIPAERMQFKGVVICAHCVAVIYEMYNRGLPLRIHDRGGGNTLMSIRTHPTEYLAAIRAGDVVEDPNTLEGFGTATTTIAGTAVCGNHAYSELKRER